MGTKRSSEERSLTAVKEIATSQPPVILASGSEAVAAIADKLMKLSPAQRAFLRLRFYFETDAACAAKVGVAPQTVRQWKAKDEAFNEAYHDLLTQPLLHARAELVLLTQKAIHGLGELLEHPNPQTRMAAIEKVLKGRDAQLLQNNVKVESDEPDLYAQLMQRLAAARLAPRVVDVAPAVEDGDGAVEAEFREVPTTP